MLPDAHFDRPRERLLADGRRALADADLVALVPGTGSAGLSARSAALGLVERSPLAGLAWALSVEVGS